jgi:glycosyltransferase involved in cell wall biosynthesis
MIAFHFPPFQGSSGVLRTWNFSRFLPEFGWQPLLLTASERAYGAVQNAAAGGLTIPDGLPIWRAAALDAARHLAVRGRYPRILALPDRWASWFVPAVTRALLIIRRHRPAVIWSTYPIASAHLVACAVQRLSGLPWVADFRDSMTEETYPSHPLEHRVYRWIESKTIRNAADVVFTTRGTAEMYATRYPAPRGAPFAVIPNGYDEDSFKSAAQLAAASHAPGSRARRVLVHTGILYPSERDPRPFLDAVATLKRIGHISADSLQIIFRASGHDRTIAPMIESRGVGDIVTLAEPIPYQRALAEMLNADGLLLFQAANCNHQIPAKLYEYLRAGRPILAMTDAQGDTAATLREAGTGVIADLSCATDIAEKFDAFLASLATWTAPPDRAAIEQRYSRHAQARQLARLLDQAGGSSRAVTSPNT